MGTSKRYVCASFYYNLSLLFNYPSVWLWAEHDWLGELQLDSYMWLPFEVRFFWRIWGEPSFVLTVLWSGPKQKTHWLVDWLTDQSTDQLTDKLPSQRTKQWTDWPATESMRNSWFFLKSPKDFLFKFLYIKSETQITKKVINSMLCWRLIVTHERKLSSFLKNCFNLSREEITVGQ